MNVNFKTTLLNSKLIFDLRTPAESRKKQEEKHRRAEQRRQQMHQEKTQRIHELTEKVQEVINWKNDLIKQQRDLLQSCHVVSTVDEVETLLKKERSDNRL